MRGKRKLPVLSLACLALAAALPAGAQDSPRILRVAAFGGDGIQGGEAAALQNLVTSYVMELKMFRVIDEGGQELALREAETAVQLGVAKEVTALSADYVLSARVNRLGSLIVYTMDVTRTSSGEKKSVADTFTSVNDLILASRRLTRSLFEASEAASTPQAAPKPAPPAAATAAPSLARIAGTWKGDKNVDRVTILPDGRGFAVLASGVRMAVKATIEGSTVVIRQDQPNSPEFYRPSLDMKSARTVAASARPWRWLFSLSADGASLGGVKESVYVEVSEKGVVTLDNGFVRDAVWTKLYRPAP
jgi:hypothetical protein